MYGYQPPPMIPPQQQQSNQQTETCLICKGPCINFKIPLEFDMNRGVFVHACSTQCQLLWQNLVQALQQQQQQQALFQQQQQQLPFSNAQHPQFIPNQQRQPQSHHNIPNLVSPPQLVPSHSTPSHSSFVPQMLPHQGFQPMGHQQHHLSYTNNQNSFANPISHPPPVLSSPHVPPSFSNPPAKILKTENDPRSKTTVSPPILLPLETSNNKPPSFLPTTSNSPPVLSPPPPAATPSTAPINSSNPTSPPAPNNVASPSSSENSEVKVVQYRTLYIVVDTNVLLEHLWFILNLRYLESVTVVVPIVAIHELDGLKKSEDESVASRSRNALKVIHEGLQENQSLVKKWLRGQSPHEMLASSDTMIMRNNDDQILNCALWFSKFCAGPEDGLILATNDTGLSVKAMMQGLDSKNVSQLSSCLPAKTEPGAPLTLILNNKSTAPIIQATKATVIPRESLPMKWEAKIWKKIFCNLPPRCLPKMTGICFSFYQLINGDDDVWRLSIQNAFDDRNGVLIPPEISPKQWYIKWRRQTLTIPSK